MKAQVFTLTQEGFITGLGIRLESGLLLRTFHASGSNMAWLGNEVKKEIIAQFDDFLNQLESLGFEITDRDLIEEYR